MDNFQRTPHRHPRDTTSGGITLHNLLTPSRDHDHSRHSFLLKSSLWSRSKKGWFYRHPLRYYIGKNNSHLISSHYTFSSFLSPQTLAVEWVEKDWAHFVVGISYLRIIFSTKVGVSSTRSGCCFVWMISCQDCL